MFVSNIFYVWGKCYVPHFRQYPTQGDKRMKKYLFSALFMGISMAVIPAVPVCFSGEAATEEGKSVHEVTLSEVSLPDNSYSSEPYRVLDISTGKISEVPVRDYVIGAVCAEMPASFEPEALKAQALAAHTYAERQRIRERSEPTEGLGGADFSNDTAKYQGYFDNEKIRHYFGDNYDEYYAKISAAAEEVLPYIITYNDEPIIAAFCSMSAGTTESAENAWGSPVDYLVPVDSSFDKTAPKYEETVSFDKDFLRGRLEKTFDGIQLGDDMTKWLTVAEISDSGTVLTVRAGDMTVKGSDIREALGLRSADFDITCDGDEAVITTRGYGHGVGMSQYGANAMAAAGSSWRDIIEHYYPGCSIDEVKN